jgi:hypothetical protein
MPVQCERKNRRGKFSSWSRINADQMHHIQTVTKIKMATLAMHRSEKPYVHATMKNEALLDA